MADIKITVDAPSVEKEIKPQATIELKARRTVDGNILIMDHEEIDIVVYPEDKKILVLAKNDFHQNVYEAQDRFFNFLWKSGIVDMSSIHGGNVYASMEGAILESNNAGIDSVQMAMLSIDKFMDIERPYFMVSKAYDKVETDRLTEPPAEDSTELGEVDPEEEKGTLGTANAYGIGGTHQQRGRRFV
jgi:hypothetical protein